jgi:hypothetical protein
VSLFTFLLFRRMPHDYIKYVPKGYQYFVYFSLFHQVFIYLYKIQIQSQYFAFFLFSYQLLVISSFQKYLYKLLHELQPWAAELTHQCFFYCCKLRRYFNCICNPQISYSVLIFQGYEIFLLSLTSLSEILCFQNQHLT